MGFLTVYTRNLSVEALVFLFAVIIAGCSPNKGKLQEDPVLSFKQTVEEFLKLYKQSKHEGIFHVKGFEDSFAQDSIRAGWRKDYSELVSDAYSVDVRKTDSLVSPYIGTLDFDTKMYVSNLQDSEDAARETQIFTDTASVHHHRHSYAYQDGAWVVKSRKQINKDVPEADWEDCKDGE